MPKTDVNALESPSQYPSIQEPIERELIAQVQFFAEQHPGDERPLGAMVPEFSILRRCSPTPLEATLYSPSFCLILQGEKEVHVGTRCLHVAAGHSVVVSHHIPIVARVTKASEEVPFLALVLELDLSMVRGLYDEIGERQVELHLKGRDVEGSAAAESVVGNGDVGARLRAAESPAGTLDIAPRDALLLGAMSRLFGLHQRPSEIPIMAPLILREVHYRLLLAGQGAMLRQLVRRRSHASRIAKAIAWIRENFAQPIIVAEVARVAGMSPSTFHEHFKAFTATTPLQYQKDIRLLAARELLRDGVHSVSGAAFEVGYESPSQFSREYARKFEQPPSWDLANG